MADATGTTVWRWDQAEPFGNNPADEDPDANSVAFDLPLRLPGQRYDQESGLHYNNYRDFGPSLGRYVQSDPVGLRGGLNTYAYVGNKPVRYTDPSGLWMPWIHKMMTEHALERARCRKLEPSLPFLTADVDFDSVDGVDAQNPVLSHMHAMCDGTASPNDIDQQPDFYQQYLQGLKRSCAPKDLARLLHAAQDAVAPGHRGFKCWGNLGPLGLIAHGLGDAFPSGSSWGESVDASVLEIAMFKNRCPCACQ